MSFFFSSLRSIPSPVALLHLTGFKKSNGSISGLSVPSYPFFNRLFLAASSKFYLSSHYHLPVNPNSSSFMQVYPTPLAHKCSASCAKPSASLALSTSTSASSATVCFKKKWRGTCCWISPGTLCFNSLNWVSRCRSLLAFRSWSTLAASRYSHVLLNPLYPSRLMKV